MVAMPLTLPDVRKAPAAKSSAEPVLFQPLDPAILNASIAAFYIGRGSDGFWLVRDVKGKNGGAFLFKSSALAFARRASQPNGCATIFPSEPFELDVENQGNPLIPHLRQLMRLVHRIANPAAGSLGASGVR
jgi:hypothetical protein